MVAFVVAVAPCAPGFIDQFKPGLFSPLWDHIYTYAWFVTFAIGFVLYLALMTIAPPRVPAAGFPVLERA